MERKSAAATIRLAQGDITRFEADAIVNAANSSLMGGGGVDGAIHTAGGPSILEECRRIRAASGPCAAGKAVVTGAGRLMARFVIHAVGPVWRGGRSGEAALLSSAYRESLRLAVEKGCSSVAFPAISTGAYGYPPEEAAAVSLREVLRSLKERPGIREVTFVLYSPALMTAFQTALAALGSGSLEKSDG